MNCNIKKGTKGVYLIRNKTNGKIYIGQTKRKFEEREKEHFKDAFRPKSSNYNCIFYKL